LFSFNANAFEKEVDYLNQFTSIQINGGYCNKYNWNAIYLPLANKIELCKDNITKRYGSVRTDSQMLESLLHEAVHLAQDCKAGITNKKMTTIETVSHIPGHVIRDYKKHDHKIEAEAYYMSANSKKVFAAVSKYCPTKGD